MQEGQPTAFRVYQRVSLAVGSRDAHTTEDASLYRDLAGMANNLNQLARLSHQTSLYHTSRKVDEALDKVLAIISEYRQGKERNG